MTTHSSILAWRIPWAEKPVGYSPWGHKELDTTERLKGFLGGSAGKESACSAGDLGSVPRLGRSPGEGNGCPLQYPGLEKSMDGGASQATVHGVEKSQT